MPEFEFVCHTTDIAEGEAKSFNIMGKPIVHSVEDALAVFVTSGIDAVLIEDLLIEKTAAS